MPRVGTRNIRIYTCAPSDQRFHLLRRAGQAQGSRRVVKDSTEGLLDSIDVEMVKEDLVKAATTHTVRPYFVQSRSEYLAVLRGTLFVVSFRWVEPTSVG